MKVTRAHMFVLKFLLASLLLCGQAREAAAVGAFRPMCEDQREAVNSKKATLDQCIENVQRTIQGGEPQVKTKIEKEAPCAGELQALIGAGRALNQCMEKSAWWLLKKTN